MMHAGKLASLIAGAAVATVVMTACSSPSNPSLSSTDGSPVPTVADSNAAFPSASSSATATARPRLILDGLLKTASGEHVIEDSISDYESRGSQGWQAATRSSSNPISNYRAQLIRAEWKLIADEPTRIAAKKGSDWINLITTDVQSFTGNLPWATVIAYVHLATEVAEP